MSAESYLQTENLLFTVTMILYFASMIFYFLFVAVKKELLSRIALGLQALVANWCSFDIYCSALKCI